MQYILTNLIYFKRLPTSCKGFGAFGNLFLSPAESQSTLSAFILHGLIYLIRATYIYIYIYVYVKGTL